MLHYQPAFNESEERIIIQYARRTFTGYQALPRSPNIPPITEAQAEALDALHFLADQFHVGLDFRQGDIQYVNNLSIFHARDGFKDTRDQQYVSPLNDRDPEAGTLIWWTDDISCDCGFVTLSMHGRRPSH